MQTQPLDSPFVFLGGTTATSRWREKLIPMLRVGYYNPQLPEGEDWTKEHQRQERLQRQMCTWCLYVITPRMKGGFSIVEVTDDSNKKPEKTIFCVLKEDEGEVWTPEWTKSWEATKDTIRQNGAVVKETLEEVAEFLNSKKDHEELLQRYYDSVQQTMQNGRAT